MDDTIVYQNVIVGEGRAAPDGGSTFEGVLAQVDAQRGGTIISDGLAYYASLQRLVLSTRLPTLIAELAVPTSSATVYELTMVVTTGGTAYTYTRPMLLPRRPPAQLKVQTTQPRDDYAFVNNIALYIQMWNELLKAAWDGCNSNGALTDLLKHPIRPANGRHRRPATDGFPGHSLRDRIVFQPGRPGHPGGLAHPTPHQSGR